MKILTKLLTALVALTIVGIAIADDRNGHNYGYNNAHGVVYNHDRYRYRQTNNYYRGGCDSNCAILFGSAILGAVIVNEITQPQPIVLRQQIVPQQVIYVQSSTLCDGGSYINGIYYCPVLR